MLGSAVMSEIFLYGKVFPLNVCLAVIGFSDGSAIGVRSAPNLIDRALFRYLKNGPARRTQSIGGLLHRA